MKQRSDEEHERYYEERLAAGEDFENLVVDVLYRNGLPVVAYKGRRAQQLGENRAGFEIKLDERFAATRNLYIEVAEKSRPSRPDFTPSGVYRDDNTWIYVIGNRAVLFLFGKRTLQRAHRSGRYEQVETETSRGFLLPERVAREIAERVIELEVNGARGSR